MIYNLEMFEVMNVDQLMCTEFSEIFSGDIF